MLQFEFYVVKEGATNRDVLVLATIRYTKFNFKHLAPDLQFDIIVSESRTGEFGTNFETPDAYMEFRTAFSCDNLEQMIFHFEINNEPFLFLDERMYVKTPSGKIFEIYEE